MGAAEISALAAAVAAVGSVGTFVSTHRAAIRRFEHERELADMTDARNILTSGVLELGRMKGVLTDVRTAFGEPLKTGQGWPVDTSDEFAKLEAAADALEGSLARVRTRFEPESDVVRELNAAYEDVTWLKNKYRRAWKLDQSESGRKEPWEDFEDAFKVGIEFDAHGKGYQDAAQRAVGVKLSEAGKERVCPHGRG